jgi:hypothetical protein
MITLLKKQLKKWPKRSGILTTLLDNLVTMHDGYKHQYRETVGFSDRHYINYQPCHFVTTDIIHVLQNSKVYLNEICNVLAKWRKTPMQKNDILNLIFTFCYHEC